MSVIVGILKESGESNQESEIRQMLVPTERYATGAGAVHISGRAGMGLQPSFSHARSRMDDAPLADPLGNVLSLDGRLDNYEELADMLNLDHSFVSDSRIVLAMFMRWGKECFRHLIGDWALALWSESQQTLILARDHAGTRTLYFRREGRKIRWSTYLDTFQTSDDGLRLSEDFVARYLASSPIRDLTPYEGIRSVLPGRYLIIREGRITERIHWDATVTSSIHYKRDSEYEEHFLSLFQQSVERRTGPGAPILAQLSGGMDSTSIVCMSDYARRSRDPEAELLDTVSFYDDAENSLNERPYFSITEARRGKVGTHIDTAFSHRTFEPHDPAEGIYLFPGADSGSLHQEHIFYDLVWRKGFRSILSGVGGDEVLGGIPIGLPELADYLVAGKSRVLLRQSVAWSLVDRSPVLATLGDTIKYAVRLYGSSRSCDTAIPPWISDRLRRRLRENDARTDSFLSRVSSAPHCLDNAMSWWSVMENPPHLTPQIVARPEYRYPFLDKDLVNFLFSIPREQVLRPGRRRSLMRRALKDIVSPEILERRRKAFQLRAPLHAMQEAHSKLMRLFEHSIAEKLGFVDIDALRTALRNGARGDPAWWQALLKMIALELWLKSSCGTDGDAFVGMRGGRDYQVFTA